MLFHSGTANNNVLDNLLWYPMVETYCARKDQ